MSRESRQPTVGWFRSTLGITKQARSEGDGRETQDDERLARVWGIAACDVCGRTILLGEHTAHFGNGERVVEVCAVCESDVVAQGYRRAA